MSDYLISYANLAAIESGLNAISNGIGTVNGNISVVNSNVSQANGNIKIVQSNVEQLAADFHNFVQIQLKANAKANSQTRLIQIRQELEKKYGHYDIVRRTTTGILQADDLAIVKKSTISNATEEMMISTPGYWLAPCLVALAAWINDQQELAEKAVIEGLKRDDEKSSLFWALVCRRADRKPASLKWFQRYLANQNEEDLDRKTVILLDAFASGLLGADSEGVISKQMTEWLDRLSAKPGFVSQQTKQWSAAIKLKRKPTGLRYPFLYKYSKTWPVLQDIMEGASLHAEILNYFSAIFEQEASTDTLKEQLDEILDNLVTSFDSEELPLRREERYHQLVVDCEGDENLARRHMEVEQTAFDEHKDFTQLLTDAAMKPESSNASVSTQKFAIALSKEWINTAYNDVTAENRAKIPESIEINVDTFNGRSADGKNEEQIIREFGSLINHEKERDKSAVSLSGFEKFCLWGGAAIGLVGIIMMATGNILLGVIALIAGGGLVINHFSKKNKVRSTHEQIDRHYETKRKEGEKIIRAMLAEIVDFRAEFARRDAESQKVLDFLEQISPDQYVRKLASDGRHISVSD